MLRTSSATPWCCNLNSPSGNNIWNFYYLISSSVLWHWQVFQEGRLQFTLHFMEYKKCVRYWVKSLYSIPTKMHLQLLAIPEWLTNCRFPGRTHTMCVVKILLLTCFIKKDETKQNKKRRSRVPTFDFSPSSKHCLADCVRHMKEPRHGQGASIQGCTSRKAGRI